MSRRSAPLLALILAVALFVSGLGGTAVGSVETQGGEKTITLSPLCTRFDSSGTHIGCVNEVTIHLRKGGNDFRVGFTEDEVAGTGDQWRAAGWNAATTATLLTGSPLTGVEITFDVTGEIDGPSAGALMTVGVLALMRGDKVKKNISMTGTINPDGTIGPVGGIPYKVDGAVEGNKNVMLIPDGQRNSFDDDGNLIDVVDLGSEKNVDVSEVADIYEAYKEFTGEDLPRLQGTDTDLSSDVYDRLESLVEGWNAEFNSSVGEFGAVDPTAAQFVASIAALADEASTQSANLSQEGVQAGAYVRAVLAAAYANAAVKASQALTVYSTQGSDAFISQIRSSAAVSDTAEAFFGGLKNFKPKTLSEAAGLIDAYGFALDALLLSQQAENYFQAGDQATTEDDALAAYIIGAVIDEMAGTFIDSAKEIQDLSADLSGPKIKAATNIKAIADFFRKAAQANVEAFDTLIVKQEAEANGVSESIVRDAIASNDFDYLLAVQGSSTLGTLVDDFLKNKTSAAYATLGGATVLYSRSATLLAKYYSLGAETDENGDVVAIAHEQALLNALDVGEEQAAGAITALRAKKTDPARVAGDFEIAGIDREGDLSAKLDALSGYFGAFIGARVLAYLGGFPTAGLE